MPLNFDTLPFPGKTKAPTDPLEIFRTLPRLATSPGDLWAVQKDVLQLWNRAEGANDVVISLNTGAGKSLIGLLIAQSELNSGRTPVVYACATNDLVRQTATEAEEKLGLTFTTRIEGEFSNTLFEEGKAICITNYNAIFTSRSAFRGQLFPRSVIFDDAHVAENALRGSLTVSVLSHKHSSVYAYIRAVIRDYFIAIGSKVEFEATLNPNSPSILYVPPKCISEKESEVLTMLRDLAKVDKEVMFPLDHIASHLSRSLRGYNF